MKAKNTENNIMSLFETPKNFAKGLILYSWTSEDILNPQASDAPLDELKDLFTGAMSIPSYKKAVLEVMQAHEKALLDEMTAI